MPNLKNFVFIILVFALFSCLETSARNDTYRIKLENGVDLNLKEHKSHRWLPHAYHDQVIDSINALYPENKILVKRRYGKIGSVIYSLIAYKESNNALSVTINGVVIKDKLAWVMNAEVPEFKLDETLVLTMERLPKLPSLSN